MSINTDFIKLERQTSRLIVSYDYFSFSMKNAKECA